MEKKMVTTSFIFSGSETEYKIDSDHIDGYPYKTLLYTLVHTEVGVNKSNSLIELSEFKEYFHYIPLIYKNSILTMRDLTLYIIDNRLLTINYKEIFTYNHYKNIVNMLSFYGFNTFKRDDIDRSVMEYGFLNSIKYDIDKKLDSIAKRLSGLVMEYNICIHGLFPLSFILNDGICKSEEIYMYIRDVDFYNLFDTHKNYPFLFDRVKEKLPDILYPNYVDVQDTGTGYEEDRFIERYKISMKEHKLILIVINCNPTQLIRSFDFNFLKVFYDGYHLGVMDWNSVLTRSHNLHYHLDDSVLTDDASLDIMRTYVSKGLMIFIRNG